MIICNSCQESKDESCFRFRKEYGTYRKTCRKCNQDRSKILSLLRRKTLTEDQRNSLKARQRKYNKQAQEKRQRIRLERLEKDLARTHRTCSKCKIEKKSNEFSRYTSIRYKRDIFKSACKVCLAVQASAKEKTPRGRFTNYKGDAKRRGFVFDLTFTEFSQLLQVS